MGPLSCNYGIGAFGAGIYQLIKTHEIGSQLVKHLYYTHLPLSRFDWESPRLWRVDCE
jgi:hypothetical protein